MTDVRLGSLDPTWKHIHVIGIGGAGNSGMAEILLSAGYRVSGSDSTDSVTVTRLKQLGADVHIGHDAAHVSGADCVVHSAAVGADNPEMRAAQGLGIPLMPRGRFLANMVEGARTLAFSGTHGKTTTSAMAATILMSCDLDPTFLVGSGIVGQPSGARLGRSGLAVVEADEAYGSFSWLRPAVSVVTNVDEDHLDHHLTMQGLGEAFRAFMAAASESVVVCYDHEIARSLAPPSAMTYGIGEGAILRATDVVLHPEGGSRFEVSLHGSTLGEVQLRCTGAHNVVNALAAMAACMAVGIGFDGAAIGLGLFTGTARRFEYKGELLGADVFDDYAHHPQEIKVTIEAARSRTKGRLVVVFQPHLYSRTLSMSDEFALALSKADVVIVTDVYPAREAPMPGVSGRLIADAVVGPQVHYAQTLQDAATSLIEHIEEEDLVITMGAGDVTSLFEIARRSV